MINRKRSMGVGALFVILPLLTFSGELEVRKQILSENGDIEESTLEHTITFFDDKNGDFHDTRVELSFDKSGGEFEKHVAIAIRNSAGKYRFCSFNAEIPFYREKTNIDFLLFGHQIKPGSRSDIRELRSTDPNELGSDELFRYYAKSRIQAAYVLKNVLPTDAVSRDNIKSVYSFLQATNNLAIKRYIQPDQIAERSAIWLSEACKNSENVCDGAVRVSNADQVVAQYRALDQFRFEKLYDQILDLRTIDFDEYCDLMVSLQDSLQQMQDDDIRKINRRKLTAQVALAVAACYAKSAWGVAYKKGLEGKNRNEILQKQMWIIQRQLTSDLVKASEWPALSAQLEGHKQDLSRLIER